MTNIHLLLVPCPTCRHLNLQNTVHRWMKMRVAEQLSPFQLDRLEDLMGYVHNIFAMCREAGADFLSALTDFTNLVLAGRCPEAVAPVFFGGRLLALNKKTGGIRPISIGFTLRRLASKCANSFGTNKQAYYFYPHQLGIGTSGGCEAAVHSARRYLEELPRDHVLVKLDFSNAFNSIHRREILLAVYSRMPESPQIGLQLAFRSVLRSIRCTVSRGCSTR